MADAALPEQLPLVNGEGFPPCRLVDIPGNDPLLSGRPVVDREDERDLLRLPELFFLLR